jgi:hypothetical protein
MEMWEKEYGRCETYCENGKRGKTRKELRRWQVTIRYKREGESCGEADVTTLLPQIMDSVCLYVLLASLLWAKPEAGVFESQTAENAGTKDVLSPGKTRKGGRKGQEMWTGKGEVHKLGKQQRAKTEGEGAIGRKEQSIRFVRGRVFKNGNYDGKRVDDSKFVRNCCTKNRASGTHLLAQHSEMAGPGCMDVEGSARRCKRPCAGMNYCKLKHGSG